MTMSFKNNNNVIVYALEKVITYARINQHIFLAQSVWWISSIIGLQAEQVSNIDKLRLNHPAPEARNVIPNKETIASAHPCNQMPEISKREGNPEVNIWREEIVSPTPRDIQDDPRPYNEVDRVHPDRIHQVRKGTLRSSSEEQWDSEPNQQPVVLKEEGEFLRKSRKQRKAFIKQKAKDQLSRTRSGKIIAKPLSTKQRQYLQSIPRDTIVEYIADRK